MKKIILFVVAAAWAAPSVNALGGIGCVAAGAERSPGIRTLKTQNGLMLLPCSSRGVGAHMTLGAAAPFLEAAGLKPVAGPLLGKAGDPENPEINREIARAGKMATALESCLRGQGLLPEIPVEPTPLSAYLDRVRERIRGNEEWARAAARECLKVDTRFTPGADWSVE